MLKQSSLRETLRRLATENPSIAIRQCLQHQYGDSWSPEQAQQWAETVRMKPCEPRGFFDDKWMVMLFMAVVSGPQPTIDGKIVNCDPPFGIWTGCNGLPYFETEQEALTAIGGVS